jgi:prophage antirepressor-like protein
MDILNYKNNEVNWESRYFVNMEGETWFNAKDAATNLGYKDTTKAIANNVHVDDRKRLNELWGESDSGLTFNERNSIYINESGLYYLLLSSNKPEAKQMRRWITKEVLPSIRKYGSYIVEPTISTSIHDNNTISLQNETDLHEKVVRYINKYYPHIKTIAGLGELQDEPHKRIEAKRKGYVKGQPDLSIPYFTSKYNGLVMEFKTPNGMGRINDSQTEFLNSMQDNKYKSIVSNNYDDITREIIQYCNDIRVCCKFCARTFKQTDEKGYKNHQLKCHRTE